MTPPFASIPLDPARLSPAARRAHDRMADPDFAADLVGAARAALDHGTKAEEIVAGFFKFFIEACAENGNPLEGQRLADAEAFARAVVSRAAAARSAGG